MDITLQNPFGRNGDFITSPNISFLFNEIIAIDYYSSGKLRKPKKFN